MKAVIGVAGTSSALTLHGGVHTQLSIAYLGAEANDEDPSEGQEAVAKLPGYR